MHQTVAQRFEVPKTEDLTLAGLYDVTVRSEFSYPSDYTLTSDVLI